MEPVEKAVIGEYSYKTPSYTRRAYKNYYDKNKEDPEFVSKRRKAQAEYYQRNKIKILEKKAALRKSKKDELTEIKTEDS